MDNVSAEDRSRQMRLVTAKDTKPEWKVRRLAHSLGYRYRLHYSKLPGKPDLAFPGRRKVIFVHGCFWHQHSAKGCKLARTPKSNKDYWLPKLQRNVERDARHREVLESMGWDVLVVWECQLGDEITLAKRLRTFLG